MPKILILTSPDENVPDAFHTRWQSFLAHEAEALPGLIRIVHNRATPVELRPISDSGRVAWSGVTEFWFDDWGEAAIAATRLRAANVLEGVRTEWLPVDDRLMVDTGERPLLVKVMILWKRKDGVSRLAAQDYWAGDHVRLGFGDLDIGRFLRRYFQNHVVDRDGFDSARRDAAAEFWVRDNDAFGALGGDHEMLRRIAEDEASFMAPDGSDMLILDEAEIYRRASSDAPWIAA